jgi:hypothetical protein
MKNKTSIRKIAANRKNALRSTGPKTEEGKNKVRLNSLRHGLLSREVVIEKGDCKENRAEYDALLESLVAERQPVGMIEEMLVDRIASCYWRLRRAIRCEVGGLGEQLDTVWLREEKRRGVLFSLDIRPLINDEGGNVNVLLESSKGVELLIEQLEQAHDELGSQGFLSEGLDHWFEDFVGEKVAGLRSIYSDFVDIVDSNSDQTDETTESPAGLAEINEARQKLLAAIDDGLKQLRGLLPSILEREKLEAESRIATLYLPPKELGERILRYETTIERELYRAIILLEQIQRQRQSSKHVALQAVEVLPDVDDSRQS